MDKYYILKKFGENVKKQREIKNITLKELSEKSGIRKTYIIKIEQGKALGVKTSDLFRLAAAINIRPHVLVENIKN